MEATPHAPPATAPEPAVVPPADVPPPVIELERITRLYGTVIGVNDMTLSLPSGAYGLVGPNGAGKTTLIGLITGLLRPSRGQVRIFGVDPCRHRHVLGRIGLCPASELLLPRTSARGWVVEMMMLQGYSPRAAAERAESALVRTGLKEVMHRPIETFSLGMRQRVKLAQAIAHEPDLLILDEPFNGLDPIGRFEMTELLQDWIGQGKTLILASHVLPEVEAVTDAFLLIYGGRLLASGTADELRELVAELPQQVTLYGRDVDRLAGRLADQPWVDSVRLSPDRLTLRIEARRAGELYRNVTHWIGSDRLHVERMSGAEGELSALFSVLTRRHRGYAG
ncbi:ABC transporter ATP-binding protein [Candidatus Laterigemmans baculatus]|uniref:ABC transporter ATP-binding protein n=1 Tax=Candidatus Laterigemmans baculatus TaxID=2770505 RepID=UPI001F20E71D|nr:ABC transporter ATP-binding protein [Candidatus Laterigemmans baculatus]